MSNNYTVFHLHDDTSNCNGFADSTTDYSDYIKLAKEQGMKALAFSNHGGIYDWIRKKQDCDRAGIKYIHGIELYMCTELHNDERGYHVGLYARNWDGVKELNSLISLSTLKGVKEDKTDRHFYYNPRISLDELMNTSSNIIVTSACLGSMLWQITKQHAQLNLDGEYEDAKIRIGYRDRFLKWMSKNNDRCFLEIQYHNHPEQNEYNKLLAEWGEKYKIPLIAGTDTHSSSEYKSECRKILQKSKESYYGDEDAFDLIWKTYDELVTSFKEQNSLSEDVILDAINNTNVFADMVEEFTLNSSFKYPNLYGENAVSKWRDVILEKYNKKVSKGIINSDKKYRDAIQEEFQIMVGLGMESFMLFLSELVDYCKDNNIPYGFCRGSVGGSMVAYITDITDVDSIRWNTAFSRFVNADRISLGDVDIDFAPEDREKVYKYIIDRFTPKNTAYVSQFGTLKDRGTIDVLAKGLEYKDLKTVAAIKDTFEKIDNSYKKIIQEEVNLEDLAEEEGISGGVDFEHHDLYKTRIRNVNASVKLDKLIVEFEQLKADNMDLFYYFDGIKGTIHSKGTHPSGIIGSPITLPDNLGVFYKDGDENMPISTCAMKAVDSINYVKFDILGLKAVGIMKDVYNYIGSHYLKSHEIDWDDQKVWEDMNTSRVGVFQFEKQNSFDHLKDFNVKQINHMSLVNASIRPSGKSYRDRLIAGEFHKNPSKRIDELLADNNGWLVFQEDTIKFLTDICGFSGSLADTTRRAIGKKDLDLLQEQLPKIIDGYCENSDQPREIAEKEVMEFIKIIDDSSEYQFGRNHSTGYSMNGFASVRQRTYYPLEFVTAYLNRADNEDDIYMGTELAEQLGITINPIKFRYSLADYAFDRKTNSIYKGIRSIKFLSESTASELYGLRGNRYKDFYELMTDIKNNTTVGNAQLTILIKLNFFSEFGENKKLLDYAELFIEMYDRKQLKKTKAAELNIPKSITEKYSRQTAKTYMDLNTDAILKEMLKRMKNDKLALKEQIEAEVKYLGYAISREEKLPDDYYVVTTFKTYNNKSRPYITIYSPKTGDTIKTKVTNGRLFKQKSHEFDLLNIIHIPELKQQFKTRNVAGEWVKTDEIEHVVDDWSVIN